MIEDNDKAYYTAALIEYKIRLAVINFEASIMSDKVDSQVEEFLKVMRNNGDTNCVHCHVTPKNRYLYNTLRRIKRRVLRIMARDSL